MTTTAESMYEYDPTTSACGGTTTRENLKLPLPSSAGFAATTKAYDNRLTSPLALTTPDLENFITASSLALSTSCTTPTPTLFLKTASQATTEQEEYARGFEAALQRIQQQQQYGDSSSGGGSSSSLASVSDTTSTTYATMTPNYPIMATMSQHYGGGGGTTTATPSAAALFDTRAYSYYNRDAGAGGVSDSLVSSALLAAAAAAAEQIVPGTPPPPPNPLDPHYQEELKKRRKKERNRVAASKCRKRRLDREAGLEDKVKAMKVEQGELASEANRLRQVVFKLKQLVMAHVNGGCNVMMEQAGIGPAAAAAAAVATTSS